MVAGEKRNSAVVVNDDVTQLCMISGVLQGQGWETHTFTEAASALRYLQGEVPRIIVTDIQMPGIDGWRFCRILRMGTNRQLRNVPILAVSAVFTSEETERATREVGADDFLALPFTAVQLIERVNSLTGRKRPKQSRGTVLLLSFRDEECGGLIDSFSAEGFDVQCGMKPLKRSPEIVLVDLDFHEENPVELSTVFPHAALVGLGSKDRVTEPTLNYLFETIIARPADTTDIILQCERALRQHAFVKVEELLAKRTWELKEIKERYESMLSSIVDAVYICSTDYRIEYLNDAARRLTGKDVTEGSCYQELFHRDSPCPWCRMQEVCKGEGTQKQFEIHQADRGLWYDVSASPMKHADGVTSYVAIIRDVTEERQLRDRLRQAEKMEAVGQLAGGIAHDFNNMLGAILGYADIVREGNLQSGGEPRDQILHKRMETIMSAATKASRLVSQLLAFSRQGKYRNEVIPIGQMVEEVVSLLERTIDRSIRIELELEPACPPVSGDPQQLQSALLNLAVNARDAMPQGGLLRFRARPVDLNGPSGSQGSGLAPGTYVKIEVADNGNGIEPEIIGKIFDPYFTTKEPGKGTGLGLASAYGTIKNHNGQIEAASSPGKGTVFSVYLPAHTTGDGVVAVASHRLESMPKGHGTIMVVDDEADLREIASGMLENAGYQTISFADGAKALAYYERNHAVIDAVVLDIIMPKMGGVECFTKMHTVNSNIRAVFASGYGLEKGLRRVLESGRCRLIPKPFTARQLIEAVQDVGCNEKCCSIKES